MRKIRAVHATAMSDALARPPWDALCYDVFSREKKGANAARIKPFGFRPPRLELDAELEWVLKRAFGPSTWLRSRDAHGDRSVDIALRLDLASRIAARHPRELIEQEIGSAAAQRLREQYIATVAQGALLYHALTELLVRANAAGIPCILLKYAALNRMGVLRVGSRVASDIDVLVPHERARDFQALLKKSGYEDLGLRESSHQLPGLRDRSGVLIELHVHVPMVTLAAGLPFVRANDLVTSGLTVQSGNALLPTAPIVAAHAIAHGLMQHAQAPHMYSPLKTFADLADLQKDNPLLLDEARAHLVRTMTWEDLRDVQVLARALTEGDLEKAIAGGPGIILRHAVASRLNHRYAIQLRLGALTRWRGTTAQRSPAGLLKSLREAWEWARSEPTRRE